MSQFVYVCLLLLCHLDMNLLQLCFVLWNDRVSLVLFLFWADNLSGDSTGLCCQHSLTKWKCISAIGHFIKDMNEAPVCSVDLRVERSMCFFDTLQIYTLNVHFQEEPSPLKFHSLSTLMKHRHIWPAVPLLSQGIRSNSRCLVFVGRWWRLPGPPAACVWGRVVSAQCHLPGQVRLIGGTQCTQWQVGLCWRLFDWQSVFQQGFTSAFSVSDPFYSLVWQDSMFC